jgi:hypothetical protein
VPEGEKKMTVLEKRALSLEELESQTAFALPDRELMQTQTGLVNLAIGDITVQVPIAVAAAVCGVNVSVLTAALNSGNSFNQCPSAAGHQTTMSVSR